MVRQIVERVEVIGHITAERNLGHIFRPIRVATGLDVHVGLQEHQSEKRPRRTFRRTTIRRCAVERAEGRIQVRPHLLVDVQPEILAVVSTQAEDHALVSGLFE